MTLMHTPVCDFNAPAPNFRLQDTEGKWWTLDECKGEKGLLVMFICNHCPYVKAIRANLVKEAEKLKALGIGVVAIMSNNAADYAEDAPENMKKIAEEYQFSFPYLYDQTQEVAHAYDAICTPDFFGYNKELKLQYRGRFDNREKSTDPTPGDVHELLNAMTEIARTGQGPKEQTPSMGCSIKWK